MPQRAEEYAKNYGSGKAYTDLPKMLDETKPQVAFVAVPPHEHGVIEPELIKRKIHFLMEKPMALDYGLAERICNDAEAAGLITVVGLQDRFQSLTRIMKEYLEGKQVGPITGAWVGGIPKVPWWRKWATSGGQIVEQNIHLFDQLRYLFGEVDSVYCASGNGIVDPVECDVPGYDVDDYSSAVMKLKNGMVATINTGCFIRPGGECPSGITVYGKNYTVTYLLRSSLTITDTEGTKTYTRVDNHLVTNINGKTTITDDIEQTGIQDRIFIDAVKTGDTSKLINTYREALKSLKLTFACNESAETGKIIKL